MKKSILAVTLALCVSALAVASPTVQIRIEAPVPFTVGSTAMPAGAYDIEQLGAAPVFEITNAVTHVSAMVIGSPSGAAVTPQKGSATFVKKNGNFVLEQVTLPGSASYALPLGR